MSRRRPAAITNAATGVDRHRPRPASPPANDNEPQEPRIVSRSVVLRKNISADSLNAVADAQRGDRGREQRRALRSLAREVLAERGW